MNNRLTTISADLKGRPATARRHVATVLAKEIMDNPSAKAFSIETEYQLCRRFRISRLTVRLALGDLENRGLIFRKHGKGTFAHGNSTRIHRKIAVLIRSRQNVKSRLLIEILNGAYTATTSLKTGLMLIGTSPHQWPPNIVSDLGGVIVIPENVTIKDLENLNDRKLPFLLIAEGKKELPGPRILWRQNKESHRARWLPGNESVPTELEYDFFTAGQLVVKALNQAALTGESAKDVIIKPIVPSTRSLSPHRITGP